MRNLDKVPAAGFDAVICMDNALPHLLCEADLTQAAGQIRRKLRIGGHDEHRHTFHMYITRETSAGWENVHGASAYRAVLRSEITGILQLRGFTNVRWQFPNESRFYQPIVIATATE